MKFRVLGVLAAAYRGGRKSLTVTRTHAVAVDGDGSPLCKRVPTDHLVDDCGAEPAGSEPSCSLCAVRLRVVGGEVVGPEDGAT